MPRNHKPPSGDESATNTKSSINFLKLLFEHTEGPVNLCILLNSDLGRKAGDLITSRDPTDLEKFILRNDKKRWGCYFCVSTMIDKGHHHEKDSIFETPSLHADIDFKDVIYSPADILRIVKELKHPPSLIISSGRGYHCYWQFKEAFIYTKAIDEESGKKRAEEIARIEDALKQLCDLVGADMQVTHPAAVMRMVGTHNSKNDGWLDVTIIEQNDKRFELDDLEDWLAETSPKILREERPQGKTVKEIDPDDKSRAARYERIFEGLGYKPPIKVQERLDQMLYMGEGDFGIHATQVSVSAALLEAGEMSVEEIVALLMEYTFIAAGDYGKRWNKRAEERNLTRMCETWLKKREKDPPKTKPNSKSSDHRTRPQSTSGPAGPACETKTKVKSKDRPFHIVIGEAFLDNLQVLGHDLRVFRDSKGNEHLWHYEDGKWSLVQNRDEWLKGEVENAIRGSKNPNKSNMKIRAEACAYILCHPSVRKLQRNPFDRHGKIPVMGNLIDPYTLEAEPIRKEHYCTWTLDIIYDKEAKCPWWLQMLADTFADRSEEDRKANIELIQDFLGASLIDDKKKALRKAFILIGESNSGKSALLDVMAGVISTDEPITTPIADLGGNHGTQSFIKRAPWVLHEAFDQSNWHISSKAKLILGGNNFEINPKGKAAISMEFTAPALFATNHSPKFKESTKAMVNRMIMMHLTNVFDEDNEIGTAAEARKRKYQEPQKFVLEEEKSGILNWALIGAQRAINNGKYNDTEEGKEALHDVRLDSNLAAEFVETCIEFNSNVRMPVPDFNAAFMSWWKENRGDDRTVSPDQIGRALKALSHARIAMDRHKFKNNRNIRYYCGIDFNEAGKDHWLNTYIADNTPGYRSRDTRMSLDLKSVISNIPKEWNDHPQIVKIRAAAKATMKAKPKQPKF